MYLDIHALVYSKFTQALLYPRARYKLEIAAIRIDFADYSTASVREPQCLPLRMSFTLSFLSLVSCCVPFPSTGT